jgi:hypothetical protein
LFSTTAGILGKPWIITALTSAFPRLVKARMLAPQGIGLELSDFPTPYGYGFGFKGY